jgi:uncharacterized cupredoxin-like copper-binding protein
MPRWVKVFAIIGALFAVLVVLMLTGVLGKGHGPGRHMGGQGPSRTGGNQNASAVGGPADPAHAARTIEIATLDTMAFEPVAITVPAGGTVTFAVTNKGQTVHDFTIGDAAMQRDHASMMAHIPAGMGHDTRNSLIVQPGQTKRLTWRFGGPGRLEYACHESGHYQAGMWGTITIA